MNLSRRSYFFIIFITALGIANQWLDGSPLEIWRYLAAILIIALVTERLLIFRSALLITRKIAEQSQLGVLTQGEYLINNPFDRLLQLDSREPLPSSFLGDENQFYWHIAPKQSQNVFFSFTPTKLGIYQWEKIYTRQLGFLGLAWWARLIKTQNQMDIIPKKFRTQAYNAGQKPGGNAFFNVIGSGKEFISLRDFQNSDSLRSIDWKATARRGKKVVRIYQEQQHIEIIIALDCGRTSNMQAGSLNNLSHNINIAARLAEKAILNEDHVAFIAYADEVKQMVPLVKGHKGLRIIRNALTKVSPYPQESNLLSALLHIRQIVKHRSLIVILTEIGEFAPASPLAKCVTLLSSKHLPIIASIVEDKLIDLSESSAFHQHDPYRIYAAKEMIKQIERNILHLRKLGAEVVVTRPDKLDKAVLGHYDLLRNRHQV